MANKYVYLFGTRKSEGDKEMRNLLGGKGANLAEMARLGIPVPPGFTITTEVCNWFNKHNQSYPEGLENFDSMSLQERFAYMLGASAGTALHHLDPVLNVFVDTYRWRKDLPVTQIPEMFDLMRHEKILDVLEQLIGSEIFASPVWHVNMKLAPQHLNLADEVAASSSRDMLDETFYKFQVGKTGWHMDAITGMPDSYESQIANAWIPMTHAREENGCLLVIPGSHKGDVRRAPFPDEMVERAVPLIMDPGDVVILDNRLTHGATQNTSEADYRWAFNFRYLPTGQPSGRTFLPGFVARIALGEMAHDLILSSTHVTPGQLTSSGYQFKHPNIAEAFHHLLK